MDRSHSGGEANRGGGARRPASAALRKRVDEHIANGGGLAVPDGEPDPLRFQLEYRRIRMMIISGERPGPGRRIKAPAVRANSAPGRTRSRTRESHRERAGHSRRTSRGGAPPGESDPAEPPPPCRRRPTAEGDS